MEYVKIDGIYRPLLEIRKKSVLVDWRPAKGTKTMIIAVPKCWVEGFKTVKT